METPGKTITFVTPIFVQKFLLLIIFTYVSKFWAETQSFPKLENRVSTVLHYFLYIVRIFSLNGYETCFCP